jgi:peptide/nickel transport system ATP-binding protein
VFYLKDLLRLENVRLYLDTRKGYVRAVDGVSLSIQENELYALVGESGCGKSMTANAIMCLLPENAVFVEGSEIYLDGVKLLEKSERQMREIRGSQIAMIFQEPMTALNPVMTIGAQLKEALSLKGDDLSKTDKALELLEAVKMQDPLARMKCYPHELSGGMKQRVVIAMALAGEPRLLIADEPTTALDVTVQAEILKLLKSLQRKYQLGILFITHDLAVVAQVADRIGVMYQGKIIEEAEVGAFFQNPQHAYSQSLLAACPDMNAQRILSAHEHSPKVLLDIRNLKVHFAISAGLLKRTCGYIYAVDGVSFKMVQGETLAVVGESGCGKSTLGKAISQLIPLTSGSVEFDGDQLKLLSKKEMNKIRRKLQVIFQDPYASMNPKMMIKEVLSEGLKAQGLVKDKSVLDVQLSRLLETVGMPADILNHYPHEFSGGQRQRIAIARALSVNPKLIICDEPTSALDVSVQAQILNLLQKLKKELGLAYLFITHDLSVVSYLADRVLVMYLGKIVEQGSVHDILQNAKHPYTQSLLSSAPVVGKVLEAGNVLGELPSPSAPPSGCAYHPRCPMAQKICQETCPELLGGQWQVACHFS